jgi:hypothetical protein
MRRRPESWDDLPEARDDLPQTAAVVRRHLRDVSSFRDVAEGLRNGGSKLRAVAPEGGTDGFDFFDVASGPTKHGSRDRSVVP